jgi:mono/diheme cytochrome c family protein
MTLYMLSAVVAAGFTGAHAAFGLQFVLFVVLSTLLAALVAFQARRHLAIVTLLFLVSAVLLAAARLEPRVTPGGGTVSDDPVATFAADLARAQTAGEKLFHELGCVGCHRPDGPGVGPVLTGLFGRPVTDPGCGVLTVDDDYLREAILNPSATVAAGFAPVMPTFASKVTEEQLRALIAYVKSLRVPTRQPRKPQGES